MKNPPLILVVDDSKTDRLIIGNVLKKEGFSVIFAEDGLKAIEIALANQPDLILLDVVMPKLDGYKTVKLLKKRTSLADVPVIFLSASDRLEDKVKGLDLGGVDYITKPVQSAELLARIRVHLKIKEYIERLQFLQREQLKNIEIVQRSILVKPEDVPKAGFAVYYNSLTGAGGDFYDVVEIGDNIYGFFLSDVTGHDLKAAFITSALKVIIKQNFNVINTLTDLFSSIQNILCPFMPEGMFLSAAAMKINRNTYNINYITAGHPPILIIDRNRNVKMLKTEADLLCAFSNASLSEHSGVFHKGDRILMYSDGLLEHENSKHLNIKQSIELISMEAVKLWDLPLDLFVNRLVESIIGDKSNQRDDITLLAVEL